MCPTFEFRSERVLLDQCGLMASALRTDYQEESLSSELYRSKAQTWRALSLWRERQSPKWC